MESARKHQRPSQRHSNADSNKPKNLGQTVGGIIGRANANSMDDLYQGTSPQMVGVKQLPNPLNEEYKPIPHLPPFASQYRYKLFYFPLHRKTFMFLEIYVLIEISCSTRLRP
jgi:hypothetical protein